VTNAIALDAFWKGFRVSRSELISETERLVILEPAAGELPRCAQCGEACGLVHERTVRRIRERDLLDQRLWLEVPLRRVECLRCGRGMERVEWLAPRRRLTRRMEAWLEALVQLLPIEHVSRLTGVHWSTIKAIDQRRLEAAHGGFDATGVRRLLMDEFALHTGHRYATVVTDADCLRVLWVGEGRSREAVRPFFEQLGAQCADIEAVAMDMNSAFDLEVRAQCPKAEVVYDLFHVVAKFGREVVDRVRVDHANALRHDKPARQIVKRSRWLLLRNRGNLDGEQAVKLDELLTANLPLATVYLLKTSLKELWYAPTAWTAFKRWRAWYRLCMESDLAPAIQFAKRLKGYLRGIFASARFRLNTSVLEGINNRIKVIKRMAYGYRDSAYFFLKIKAAFPGKA
jgi:transposase